MFRNFEHRSDKLERLDTGDHTPEEYKLWQKEARLINRLLGDSRALRLSLQPYLNKDGGTPFVMLDVGAGSGELLIAARRLAGGTPALLVGAELSPVAVRSISALDDNQNITAVQCDALRLPFADDSFDFAVSSLFLHHLDDGQAVTLIGEMARVSRRRFIIIDLHRHRAAYYLYRLFGPLFLQRFTIEDGSLSILRSRRPHEMVELARRAGIRNAKVERRAAFRLVLSGAKPVVAL